MRRAETPPWIQNVSFWSEFDILSICVDCVACAFHVLYWRIDMSPMRTYAVHMRSMCLDNYPIINLAIV